MRSELIRNALQRTRGNQRRAAKLLGVKVTTLNCKIKRFGIELPGLTRFTRSERTFGSCSSCKFVVYFILIRTLLLVCPRNVTLTKATDLQVCCRAAAPRSASTNRNPAPSQQTPPSAEKHSDAASSALAVTAELFSPGNKSIFMPNNISLVRWSVLKLKRFVSANGSRNNVSESSAIADRYP